ncbi:unnamed protein product [Macrosiphum euphorbiae]|uniref:Uncharacterized protein n=1 Tax=Macrosiphum euphorbiae TaxID=13131 RepID=A0AAV0WAT5_9HEMI|nr:unnamed protein product [Macrosiphum euphorbiae]
MNDNKRKNSGSIATWLEKRSKTTIQDTRTNMMNDPIPIAVSSVTQVHLNQQSPNEPTTTHFSMTTELSNDIGDYLEKGSQTDHVKARFLEAPNVPDNNFLYPFSLHNKKGKQEKRYLKRDHFIQYKWLVYSQKKGGVFCNYCVFFANKGGKDKNVTLKSLVTVPLDKYAKMLGETGDFSTQ